MSLGGDAPSGRAVEPPENGKVISFPRLRGLHHPRALDFLLTEALTADRARE
jgi:hypothetical protein